MNSRRRQWPAWVWVGIVMVIIIVGSYLSTLNSEVPIR